MKQHVVVRSTETDEVLWEAPTTGQALIEYVPAKAFHMSDTGEVTIEFEDREA